MDSKKLRLLKMDNKKLRQHMESKLCTFYGGDSAMMSKFAAASDKEVETEVKKVFEIKSNVSYFGG